MGLPLLEPALLLVANSAPELSQRGKHSKAATSQVPAGFTCLGELTCSSPPSFLLLHSPCVCALISEICVGTTGGFLKQALALGKCPALLLPCTNLANSSFSGQGLEVNCKFLGARSGFLLNASRRTSRAAFHACSKHASPSSKPHGGIWPPLPAALHHLSKACHCCGGHLGGLQGLTPGCPSASCKLRAADWALPGCFAKPAEESPCQVQRTCLG